MRIIQIFIMCGFALFAALTVAGIAQAHAPFMRNNTDLSAFAYLRDVIIPVLITATRNTFLIGATLAMLVGFGLELCSRRQM